jgi:hypothetical protein
MTLLATLAPGLADRVFAAAFFRTARDTSRPKREVSGGFHHGGGRGEVYGDQGKWMRRTSLYTTARTHPVMAAFGLLAAAGATGLLLARR